MNLNVPIAQQVPQIQEGISNSIGAVTNTIGSAATAIGDVRGTVNSSVQDFASKDLVGSSNEFLQTNTLVAKFVFIVFVLIAFLILMNLGIYLLSYFLQPDTSPYLIKGIKSGSIPKLFPQDPSQEHSATIYRSNNQTTGMEYTWSFWIKVKAPTPNGKTYSHVFSKGLTNTLSSSGGMVETGSNAPGVYLKNATESGNITTTTMTIVMDTVRGDDSETVDIPNIPFNKWVHIAIRLQNKILDVYINGTLKQRVSFRNVPKQNYGDVFVGQNGGFIGDLSNFRYFDRALNAFQLSNIAMSGPNMKPVPDVVDTSSDYLSGKWY
jgi:hypothetical protein